MTNYRPISLLTVFSKYSRKLCTTPTYKQYTDHRTDGFRKGIPTENAAFRLQITSWNLLTKKMDVVGIICDLAKAFDYVNHEILLVHLQFYGIPDVAEDWFRCYVRNRRQKVEVTSPNSTKNLFSACGRLKHGVLRGSILVSLLFTICINDLPIIYK